MGGLRLQGEMAEVARELVDKKHADLIQVCSDTYVPRFLPGYETLYTDAADGERVGAAERTALARAGIDLQLGDAMPDLLLWHDKADWLWVVEAVTSDGEVDAQKQAALTDLASRAGKAGIGFTTAYWTWREAAARQGRFKNLAVGTYLWIAEDPSKQWLAEAFPFDAEG